MDRLDRFFGIHRDALLFREQRMGLIASNIANAATPGYKARDIGFGAALAAKSAAEPMARTNAAHLAGSVEERAELRYRTPLQPSLDGNTVELATEQLQFAETALRYRSTLGMLTGRIQSLTAAMKVE